MTVEAFVARAETRSFSLRKSYSSYSLGLVLLCALVLVIRVADAVDALKPALVEHVVKDKFKFTPLAGYKKASLADEPKDLAPGEVLPKTLVHFRAHDGGSAIDISEMAMQIKTVDEQSLKDWQRMMGQPDADDDGMRIDHNRAELIEVQGVKAMLFENSLVIPDLMEEKQLMVVIPGQEVSYTIMYLLPAEEFKAKREGIEASVQSFKLIEPKCNKPAAKDSAECEAPAAQAAKQEQRDYQNEIIEFNEIPGIDQFELPPGLGAPPPSMSSLSREEQAALVGDIVTDTRGRVSVRPPAGWSQWVTKHEDDEDPEHFKQPGAAREVLYFVSTTDTTAKTLDNLDILEVNEEVSAAPHMVDSYRRLMEEGQGMKVNNAELTTVGGRPAMRFDAEIGSEQFGLRRTLTVIIPGDKRSIVMSFGYGDAAIKPALEACAETLVDLDMIGKSEGITAASSSS